MQHRQQVHAGAGTGTGASGSSSGFGQFLSRFRVEKGHEFTHTSLGKGTAGSFYIPGSSHDEFLARYKAALARGEELYLTEKHRYVGPVIVDLDFRLPSPERRYTPFVPAIVRIYGRAMAEMFRTPEEFDLYVTEKPAPTLYKALVKDGLHILAPAIVTRSSLQLLLRKDVLAPLEEALRPLECINRIEDVVDEAVIERNNWMMYGSKKPGGEPYKVTRVFRYSVKDATVTEVAVEPGEEERYVELFSIRNKYDDLPVRESQCERAEDFLRKLEEDRKRKEAALRVLSENPNERTNTCDNLDLATKLVSILDPARVASYNEWVRLGWCLRNIDHRLLDAWVEISKKSDKYVDGECPRLWQSMRTGGLGFGTLHMWARTDSPSQYRDLLRLDLVELIKRSANATHYDVACVVHHLYRYEYACASIKNRTWYEFRGHRWHECDSAYTLRKRLSIDVHNEYGKVISMMQQRSSMFVPDGSMSSTQQDQAIEAQQKACAEMTKQLAGLQLKLKTSKFKEDVMKECVVLFYVEHFESRLDSDVNLLGFENGVYDLEQLEFREGRPDDYVSFSTGINYVPYVEDHPTMRDIAHFWECVHPNREIREYVLTSLAACLSGAIREERFHIWTGSGCHAKGTRVLSSVGATVAVEDVSVGDRLMGDDGSFRNVLALYRGRGDMYRITPMLVDPTAASGVSPNQTESFVVNGEHVLSLKVCDASWSRPNAQGGFTVSWLSRSRDAIRGESRIYAVRTGSYASMLEALAAMDADPGVLREGDVVDVTVRAYLTHLAAVRGEDGVLRLYRPPCAVRYERGDGAPDAAQAARWGSEVASGREALFPDEVALAESPSVRRVALSAFLRGVRFVPQGNAAVAVRTLALAEQVVALSRSVGLDARCGSRLPGERSSYVTVHFDSTTREALQALCVLQQPSSSLQEGATPTWSVKRFKVTAEPDGDFYGFEVDGNHRYLMADFFVTHNSNGKSLSVSLLEKTLGQYCCKFPVTLLTQKRTASSSATPEIARAKGRRFAVLQEPDGDERLNVGQLKELSGGDTVQTRELFKAPCEWKPQFKLFLLCNQLPNVPSDDGGTWRRIRVVEFGSKFVDDPSPDHPNEFPVDLELIGKIGRWKEHFMALLVHYYKRYISTKLKEPDAVTEYTREYQRENDYMADFVDSCIEKSPPESHSSPLSLEDAFAELATWSKAERIDVRKTKKAALKKYLDKVLANASSGSRSKGGGGGGSSGGVVYRGFRLRDRFGGGGGFGTGGDALEA